MAREVRSNVIKSSKSSVISTEDLVKFIEEEKAFVVSTGFVTIGNGEQNMMLFRNPAASTKNVNVQRLFIGLDDNNTRAKIRVYLRPAGLATGVGLIEENLNLKDNAASAEAKAFDGTTISTNKRNVGFSFLIPANSPTMVYDLPLFMSPGDKILVTTENSVNNKSMHCDLVWIED